MSDELLKFQDVTAAVRKHALLVSGITLGCLLASYTAAHTLPKKFKSIAVLNIKNSYFQMPLGEGGRDATESYAEKQALIRQSIDDPFLDSLGEKFGTFSTAKDAPKRATEREILKKRVEWVSINPTNFQFGFVAREADVARDMNQFILDHVMSSLIDERLKTLRMTRAGLKKQLDSLGLAAGAETNPIATTQPELLKSELTTIEAKIRAMESQYTPSHPSVVALRRKADAIRAMLKSAQGGNVDVPEQPRSKVLFTPGQKGAKSEFFEELSKKMGHIDIVMELEQTKKDVPYLEVIEKPTLPLAHIFPKTKNFLIGGFLCGILLSGVAVGFLQLKRASVLTPQFASRYLGTPLLGILPPLKFRDEGDFIETQVGGVKNAPRLTSGSEPLVDTGPVAVGGEHLLIYTTTAFYFAIFALVRYALTDLKRKNGGLPVAPGRFLGIAVATILCTIGFTAAWGATAAPFAFPFAIGLVLGFVNPVVAAGLLVSCQILRPWELEGVQAMSVIPKLTGGLCAFSWLFHGIRGKTLTVLWNRAARLFCALAIWILASAMFSGDFDSGLQAYNNSFMIAAIIFLMVVNIVGDREGVRALSTTIVFSVMGAIAAAVAMTLERPDFDMATQRLFSFGLLGNSNDLAAMIVLAIPLAVVPVYTAKREQRSWRSYLLALTTLAVLGPALVLSQSRGAFAGLLLAGTIVFVARSARPMRSILVLSLLAPLAFIALSLVQLARSEGDLAGSTQSRLNYLIAGVNMAVHNPIMGVGFGNYPKFFESYAPSGGMEFEWGERTAHSSWILALAENGLPGFFLIVALFVVVGRSAWRQRKESPELLSAFVGYCVTMSFLSHTYMFFPYLILALVLAAAKTPVEAAVSTELQEIPA